MRTATRTTRSTTSGVDSFVLRQLAKHRQGLTHRDLLLFGLYTGPAIRAALDRLTTTLEVIKCGSVYVRSD